MKKHYLILCILAFFTNCTDPEDEEHNLPTGQFEVTTLGLSVDCRLNVLRFEEKDIARLESLVGNQYVMDQSLREGFNLDRNKFGEPNMKLRIRIRKKLDSEAIACTTLGIRHPAVFVIHAERID
ncbi:hypothetical protein [Fontibacter flavus]|uniref:Lipoprotein n=1 Tax=Fontibacter flavus TaxID=654838 RepID=A0ABV6FVV9_9BACT